MASILGMMTKLLEESQKNMRVRDRDRDDRAQERETEAVISKIPPISSTDDVELYLQGLENELAQANYPRRKWKAVLTSRLSPTLKDLVADLQADSTSQFDYFKARLLDCMGQTPVKAGQSYHELRARDFKGKSMLRSCSNYSTS